MARFNAENIDQYGNASNAGGFFSLKNDRDVARVRFMYESAKDIEGYSVHRVQVGDRERYVNCLREYDSPIDACPFCKAKLKTFAKLFVPLYNEDVGEVQLWERGKKFYPELVSNCSRYENTVSHIFEIERHGKPKDTQTTYGIYEVGRDETALADLPEAPDPLGTIILDKTAEDMEYYIDRGEFPSTETQEPIRRRSRADDAPSEMPRRSPASRRGGDRF